MQLTLVSHYGEKPQHLIRLIGGLQTQLLKQMPSAFRPYEMDQVHATIVGLETFSKSDRLVSRWFWENKKLSLPVDLAGLIAYWREDFSGFQVKMGGYQKEKKVGFLSRGQHPYLRSFSIQGNIPVAMGWPGKGRSENWKVSTALFDSRKAVESFHFCHKWHKGGYRDNDFFFVLGKIDREKIRRDDLELVSKKNRDWLAAQEVHISVDRETLSFLVYEDPELPLKTTKAFPVSGNTLSEQFLLQFINFST